METTTLCMLLLIVTCVLYFWNKITRSNAGRGKELPGPGLMEGIRVLVKRSMDNTLHLHLPEWAKKYGNIMQVNLLFRKVVFINNATTFRHLVKDAEFKELTNDRPACYFASQFIPGLKDVAFCDFGEDFQDRRRLFHNVLKFYGEGREYVEEAILNGLYELSEKLTTSDTVELSVNLRMFVIKLVSYLMTGDASDTSQENLDILMNYSDSCSRMFLIEHETVLQPFPFLRFVPGLSYKKLHNDVKESMQAMHQVYIYALKEKFNTGFRRGMMCELFALQKKSQEKGLDFPDDDTIKGLLHDLVTGGYLTTSSTLSSLFLFVIKQQDIQARIYEEIVDVIGASTPSFHHRSKMPYTEATIWETLRLTAILPLMVPHVLRKDIIFDGYFIPKSSMLSMVSWHHHHLEDYWTDPFAFKPERFLDADGQLLTIDHPLRQPVIPFGTGPRMCPGESFARSRIFLVTVYLLKYFHFAPDEKGGTRLPPSDPREWETAAILSPENYKCKIQKRMV